MWCQAMWQSSGADNRQEDWYWRYFSQGKNDHFSLFKVKDDEIGGGFDRRFYNMWRNRTYIEKKKNNFSIKSDLFMNLCAKEK